MLHHLGPGSKESILKVTTSTTSPRTSSAPEHQDLHLTESGIILTKDTVFEYPVDSNFLSRLGQPFTVLISLRSDRVNNAFLFSIRNKSRLHFGVQLLPRKVVIHTGGKQSVSFDYSFHDGQWHNFAIFIGEKTVSLFAECGKKHFSKEAVFEIQTFPPSGVFTLGRMNLQSVHFEGVVCQLEIIPSAEASTNYCKYVKHQCRHSDTYRSQPTAQTPGLASSFTQSTKHTSNEMQSKANLQEPNPKTNVTPLSHVLQNTFTSVNDTSVQGETTLHKDIASSENDTASNNKINKSRDPKNLADNVTEETFKYMNLTLSDPEQSVISINKRSKVKNNSEKGIMKPQSQGFMDIQKILNRTLYRATTETSFNNQVDPWEDGDLEEFDDYNTDYSYEVDMENYDYNYEDMIMSYEMDHLKGGKGDCGSPVS
ncbi:collagen alpha-1(XXIV) chain-like [Rhinophrynus dorsalis]